MVTHRMIGSDSDSAVMVRMIHMMRGKKFGRKNILAVWQEYLEISGQEIMKGSRERFYLSTDVV